MAHGDVDPDDRVHLHGADLVIAADGGAIHLQRWGERPHVVIGDLDSLTPQVVADLEGAGVEIDRWPVEKDRSDTELALDRAIAAGADEIVLLGAFGGARLDHAIANTLLLAEQRLSGARIRAVRGRSTARVLRAGERCEIAGRPGDLVTLLAVGGDAGGVRTGGLRYPLVDEPLVLGSSRGVSNEIERAPATVSCGSGALLVIETAR